MVDGDPPNRGHSARLERRDFERLLEFLRRTYAISDFDSFRKHVVFGLQSLVPSEINAYNEIDLRTQHNDVVYDRPEAMKLPDGNQIFERHIPEHPLIAYSQSKPGHGAVKISDLLSTTEFHRLGLYNEFFRLIGIEDQMVVSLPSPRPVVVGIALNRARRNFSERDRLLLNLASPHLLQAYRNVEAFSRLKRESSLAQRLLSESRAAVIWLKNGARAQHVTLHARALMAKYFPGRLLPRDTLPELLQRWIELELARFKDSSDVPPARRPLVIGHDGDALVVRLFSDHGQAGLLVEESLATIKDIEGSGLTRRESEVLAWVSRGKTNREISILLSISPRTVQKHLEHIFQKLGVETRTAAAARGLSIGARGGSIGDAVSG
jgi:DNA-binding CsgD family transcriptional regulator